MISMNPWFALLLAAALEPVFVLTLKAAKGWQDLPWIALSIFTASLSVFFMYLALRQLPAGITYAVWSGGGAVTTLIAAWLIFDERLDWISIFLCGLIIGSTVTLALIRDS